MTTTSPLRTPPHYGLISLISWLSVFGSPPSRVNLTLAVIKRSLQLAAVERQLRREPMPVRLPNLNDTAPLRAQVATLALERDQLVRRAAEPEPKAERLADLGDGAIAPLAWVILQPSAKGPAQPPQRARHRLPVGVGTVPVPDRQSDVGTGPLGRCGEVVALFPEQSLLIGEEAFFFAWIGRHPVAGADIGPCPAEIGRQDGRVMPGPVEVLVFGAPSACPNCARARVT